MNTVELKKLFAGGQYDDLLMDIYLDEEKLAGALELVKKASEEYQIIYFTCHESRSL